MREGLSRHEAVHAIASVIAEHTCGLIKSEINAADSESILNAAIERITAKRWHDD